MTLAILQARMSSSRLPGKVLKPILGKPMLMHQVERIMRSKLVDRLIIATSSDVSDDPIEAVCKQNGIECFRGSLENVLDRYYQTAVRIMPDHIVRLTGDCPLTDHEVIDAVIQFFLDNEYDYVSNAIKPTYPNGLDIEVFNFETLKKAHIEATLPSQMEHVTPYIKKRIDIFKVANYSGSRDLSELRWTVDEPRDFEFVAQVYEALYPNNHDFRTADILNLLEQHPELSKINSGIERNEGYKKSLERDIEIVKDGE